MHIFPLLFSVHVILLVFLIHHDYINHPFVSLKPREKMLFSGYLILQSVRASSSRAAVAKMARVLRWRLIDVINVEIATVTH